jgi:hypothetical protein
MWQYLFCNKYVGTKAMQWRPRDSHLLGWFVEGEATYFLYRTFTIKECTYSDCDHGRILRWGMLVWASRFNIVLHKHSSRNFGELPSSISSLIPYFFPLYLLVRYTYTQRTISRQISILHSFQSTSSGANIRLCHDRCHCCSGIRLFFIRSPISVTVDRVTHHQVYSHISQKKYLKSYAQKHKIA